VAGTEDDLFHAGSADPYWNESALFCFNVPERLLSGFVHFYHRPNMHYTVGGVGLWDPSGETELDCLYYDFSETVPLAPGAEMFDFTTANGLSVNCLEPLRSYRLKYVSDSCTVDLRWRAFMDPQDPAGHGGLPSGSDDWGTGHYNQGGYMQGSVSVESDEIAVDCLSFRDHSWGPRRFTTSPRGDYASALASPHSGFCIFAASTQPRDTDPCIGVADQVIFGWYMRDGEVRPVVNGERRVLERDRLGRPHRVVIDAVDDGGRELHAEGRCRNWLWWRGYAFLHEWWSLAEWDFDGQTTFGDEQDLFPLVQARGFTRRLARLGAES
jgi:hypothetical protein